MTAPASDGCAICGAPVPIRRGGARYCSESCRAMRRTRRALDRFVCSGCNRAWERPLVRGRVPRLCPECRGDSRLYPARQARVCIRCGGPGARTDYCGKSCSAQDRADRVLARPKRCPVPADHPSRITQRFPVRGPASRVFITDCAVCSATFASPYTISTCGDVCRRIKTQQEKSEGRHRRRAAERNAFVAPVDRQHIFTRDRGRCHLCGDRVLMTAHAPHPLAPTLDHVIPISVDGGTHEPANVRLAHFVCNSRKGNRGGNEQLMLFG